MRKVFPRVPKRYSYNSPGFKNCGTLFQIFKQFHIRILQTLESMYIFGFILRCNQSKLRKWKGYIKHNIYKRKKQVLCNIRKCIKYLKNYLSLLLCLMFLRTSYEKYLFKILSLNSNQYKLKLS